VLGCITRPPADEEELPFSDFGWQLWRAQEKVEQWHEDLRTLYVACTRAQDYLVLSGSLKQSPKLENPWMTTLAERFDLETGQCLADDFSPAEMPCVRVAPPPDDEVPLPPKQRRARTVSASWDGRAEFTAAIPAPPALVGEQFDAEDGSDLAAWPA
jgi:ATP-dependent exoDNAse (exonuclease V) beta subunit